MCRDNQHYDEWRYLNTRTAGVKVRQILASHKVSLTTSLIGGR